MNAYEIGCLIVEKNLAAALTPPDRIEAAMAMFAKLLKAHERNDRTPMLAQLLAMSVVESNLGDPHDNA